jgi:DNA-binding beta-propeller fold protein YncE
MENGDILVTEITGAQLTRMTREGKVIWTASVPGIHYPSDAFPTVDGKQVVVADFWKPGRVVIFDPVTKKVTWEYFVKQGEKMLDHSSIARELPDTGDILVVDDLNDRVLVIDRVTKAIIWQYGQTGKKGHTLGLLNYPDGVDIDVYRDWRGVNSGSTYTVRR